jgi:hypothetical protein
MRVIGVGFGRTGTASLKLALERLGQGPCYHMLEIVEEPARAHGWLAALRGEPDWATVLGGYNSTVDWPGAAFWHELLAAYPDAVAILTVRDPQQWFDSVMRTIFRGDDAAHTPVGRALFRAATLTRPDLRAFAELQTALIRDGVFSGRPTDREHAIEVYERHVAEVTATIPADRLLVFDVRDGWEPLCAFLGVPVPDEPFPHANDTATFRRMQRAGMVRALRVPALVTAGAAIAATILWRKLRRRR